jgi:hypothetical protein
MNDERAWFNTTSRADVVLEGVRSTIHFRFCEAEIRKSNVKLGGFGWFTPSEMRYPTFYGIQNILCRNSTQSYVFGALA